MKRHIKIRFPGMVHFAALLVILLFTGSCKDKNSPGYEFMPDMYRSPSYETYAAADTNVLSNGIEALWPPEGTVPRGYVPYIYSDSQQGYDSAGAFLKNPIPFTPEVLAQGKDLFGKYCRHCHGNSGDGDGEVVTIGGFPPPPSYSTGNSSRGGMMKDLSDGKIYHTIMYGLNMMGSHASQLTVDERWKIVHYIHKLQDPSYNGIQTTLPDTITIDSTATRN